MLVLGLLYFISSVIPGIQAEIHSISPAFKWAQSPDDVHLYIKFAHKIDAPAYNNFAKSNVQVQIEARSVSMKASNTEKSYLLTLELYGEVDPEASTYSVHTFGVSFVLKKRKKVWKRLLKNKDLKPRNMHLWWELYDKYQDDMEKLESEEKNSKRDGNRWWKKFENKCEACQTFVSEAAFSKLGMERLNEALIAELEREKADRSGAEPSLDTEVDSSSSSGNGTNSSSTSSSSTSDSESDATPDNIEDAQSHEVEDKATEETASRQQQLEQTVKVAGNVIKKVCENYDSSISSSFKKACKRLRKIREVKKNAIITMGIVLETIRKSGEASPDAILAETKASQTQKTCASLCPRPPKNLTPCKACNLVTNSIHAYVSKHKKRPEKEVLIDGACDRVKSKFTNLTEEDEMSLTFVCEKLVEYQDKEIIHIVREKAESDRRKALGRLCYKVNFCQKKKKWKKKGEKAEGDVEKASDEASKSETPEPPNEASAEDQSTSPGLEKPVSDEL
eukprot:CAMPEP_0184483008 /NCGR_PEP_ID=MMETSP0113_2-20130426/4614_1 /TAXON_ID=91329 /ORGANISM="Norrisiella sphaerica, Strain BC52" /LENGTH=506 /DNA_ID=CAMNT_0026863127 /DNA_START=348 /DNA_END=1868 /DNA_ORIENTATION=-